MPACCPRLRSRPTGGDGRLYETSHSRFAAILGPRPVGTTDGRDHELPVDFRWDFSDGNGIVASASSEKRVAPLEAAPLEGAS